MVVWVGSTLHYKSAKMAFGNRSVWSSGFWWGRDALDRRFGSVCGSSIALQVEENAGREKVRVVVWVEPGLHYKSTKMGSGKRSAWSSVVSLGMDALYRRFGSVCGPSIALQVDENAGRKKVRVVV